MMINDLKKKVAFLAVMGLVIFGGGGIDVMAAKSAYLNIIEGKVQILRSGQSAWMTPQRQVKTDLAGGDRVRTSNRARALISLDDGSKIELAPSSVFLVDFLEEKSFGFKLDLGRLRALVSKFRQRSFSIVTPTAVCAVRGTEFDVGFDPGNQQTAVSVSEGLVSVSDLKGNEVLVNPGESVSVNLEGIQQSGQGADQTSGAGGNEDVKNEIQREVGLNMNREAIEAAAAIEMKDALAQDGKTVIDAFGQRVRTESYIARDDSQNKISWVVLNTREENFNYGRFDVYAQNALPKELGSGFLDNLYFQFGSASPSNWATKDQWFMSNTKDYWIQTHSGGNPVQFSDSGYTWYETIFDNSYAAVSEAGQTRLLEHFVPAGGVKGNLLAGNGASAIYSCNPGSAVSCLDGSSPAFGTSALFFYDFYESADAAALVGDQGQQLQTIASVNVDTLNTSYSAREGYYNNWRYYLDGQFVYAADGSLNAGFDWKGDATKLHETTENRYGVASAAGAGWSQALDSNSKSLVITYDDYLINDEGQPLTLADLGAVASGGSAEAAFKILAEKTNYEFVTLAPGFGSKIDLVMPMRILNALSSEDDRPSS